MLSRVPARPPPPPTGSEDEVTILFHLSHLKLMLSLAKPDYPATTEGLSPPAPSAPLPLPPSLASRLPPRLMTSSAAFSPAQDPRALDLVALE